MYIQTSFFSESINQLSNEIYLEDDDDGTNATRDA